MLIIFAHRAIRGPAIDAPLAAAGANRAQNLSIWAAAFENAGEPIMRGVRVPECARWKLSVCQQFTGVRVPPKLRLVDLPVSGLRKRRTTNLADFWPARIVMRYLDRGRIHAIAVI